LSYRRRCGACRRRDDPSRISTDHRRGHEVNPPQTRQCQTARPPAGLSYRRRPGTLRWHDDLTHDATGEPGHDTKRAHPTPGCPRQSRAHARFASRRRFGTSRQRVAPPCTSTDGRTRTRNEPTQAWQCQTVQAPAGIVTPASSPTQPTSRHPHTTPQQNRPGHEVKPPQDMHNSSEQTPATPAPPPPDHPHTHMKPRPVSRTSHQPTFSFFPNLEAHD